MSTAGVGVEARVSRVEETAKYIELTGVVQGVGFRPFVYNLARSHGLCGWVRNTSFGVQIEIRGPKENVAAFLRDLKARKPAQARIETLRVADIRPGREDQGRRAGRSSFAILESASLPGVYQLVSPDIATCPECLAEVFDPSNRRAGYPFTNCTNCGPRFTIITDIPYDRPNTTMRDFVMCEDCRAEYHDPADRRFHAQPNACPVCGPHLRLVRTPQQVGRLDGEGLDETAVTGDTAVIREAARLLREGNVLAIKGLGGFHLACDATNEQAVRLLRRRKHRPFKPLAVMLATLDEVRRHCEVTPEEEALLCSPASPIVLLRRRTPSSIADSVAPHNSALGVMLPYTPLHHLLLREAGMPLVMTSGNLSEEPIAKDNDDALNRLGALADAFVLHNREIYGRYDDSVWAVPVAGRPQPVRRARGYAPTPIRMPFSTAVQILACGAELKNTFCLTRHQYAFVSQHIGDMENLETMTHFEETVSIYEHLFRAAPEVLACDLHPECLATRYAHQRARRQGLPVHLVQHHHAHIASCLADNEWGLDAGAVIGVAFDGTGLGPDGTIWGGEFLIAGYRGFERYGHLGHIPLPGGDEAVRNPYRTALAGLIFYGLTGRIPRLASLSDIPQAEARVIVRMIERGLNTPRSSSCGRLFDAASALLGVCRRASYEGQAAVELETAAADIDCAQMDPYPFVIESSPEGRTITIGPLLEAIVDDLVAQRPVEAISAAFHRTVAEMIVSVCSLAREERGLDTAALSGGCFQNRLLLRLTVSGLEERGFRVLVHRQVPCNDGGISLGQAAVAHALRCSGGK